jgi:hypothetical protein
LFLQKVKKICFLGIEFYKFSTKLRSIRELCNAAITGDFLEPYFIGMVVSQNYISAMFDALFFIIVGLIMLVSSVYGSYEVFVDDGLRAAFADFLPMFPWSFGSILLGGILYLLSKNARRID